MTKRQAQDAKVRARIQAKAMDLFDRYGYENVSMEDIVRALIVLNRGLLIEWRIEEGGFDILAAGRLGAEVLVRGFRK